MAENTGSQRKRGDLKKERKKTIGYLKNALYNVAGKPKDEVYSGN